jgi:RNA polymerase sigma factor (sigma-70 family)
MQTIIAGNLVIHCDLDRGNVRKLDNHRVLLVMLAGDTAAWQKFILRYSNFIYRAVIKYTDDYDEKMAVYLHILEKLHENGFERLRRFSFRSKLSTWLTVVSRRLALDWLRGRYGRDFRLKKVRVVSIDDEPGHMRFLADLATPERKMAAAERQETRQQLENNLRLAMAGLSDQERLAVQLIYFKGLKIKEVGRLIQVPAIYKFVARALQRLRTEMESKSRISQAEIEDALEGEAHE